MANFNPFALWRRFLAAPNDSVGKTIAVAFAVAVVSSLAVSLAWHVLQPRIIANKAAERQAQLDALVATMPELGGLLSDVGGGELSTLIVDLTTGEATGIDPAEFQPARVEADPETSTKLSGEQDIADIGWRPDLAQIYVLRDGRALKLVILPVFAQGYKSRIDAFLALRGDLNTVAGLVITDQSETPGLGAYITDPAWQALWPGKQIMDADGALRLAVVLGRGTSEFEVDGITGATRTGNAVGNMVRFWMGPDGFGRVLDALRSGAL